MKKLIYVIVVLAFFLFGFSFFMQNQGAVTLNYFRGWQMDVPIAILLLVTVVCGILIGYFASLLNSIQLRARIAKANRRIKSLESDEAVYSRV